MSAHIVLAVAFSTIVAVSPARAAETVWTDIAIRVYDTSGIPAGYRQASLKVAASIVSAASLEPIWTLCDEKGSGLRAQASGQCDGPMRAGELSLRIVRSFVPSGYAGQLPLGDALIDPRSGAGTLATVYVDRVEWIAKQTGTDPRALLGRAIAHELGHLLMPASGHSTRGLMRAIWSGAELRSGRARDWAFEPREVAAIRARQGQTP
jgi:hypothetical protein